MIKIPSKIRIKPIIFPFFCFAEQKDYQTRTFEFETEWKRLADEKNAELIKNLESDLTPSQKAKVQSLARAFVNLNKYEIEHLNNYMVDKCKVKPGMSLMTLHMDWPSLKKNEDGRYPVATPNWFLQQQTLAKMWPGGLQDFGAMMGSGGGGSFVGGVTETKSSSVKKEEKKEEAPAEVKERTSFDIELVSFDAAQKIKIIKEVRQLLNLGLKEAKDMVEKAPVSLKKDVKKEDAEILRDKLVGCGCVINLK